MESNQPILHQIRILDFSWVLAGPYATRLLADFGAEVIKVQPPLLKADDTYSQGYYNLWNRNKTGITLNLAKPEGIEIAKKLVKISDAVVENFSSRVMENWGLDYPELCKLKADIILLSMSVMGHSGPWRDYAGFGPTVQAFSGITRLTAYPDEPPLGIGYSYSDHIAGLYASLSLLGALEYRRRTGKGQFIDLSETEAMTSLLADSILDFTLRGQEPQPSGNGSSQFAPQGIYRCQGEDRWCAITVCSDREWEGLKRALGNPEWTADNRFSTLADRLKNTRALDNLIQDWTNTQAAEEVMARLQKEGVPAGIVQNAADLAQDPQLKAREFWVNLIQPILGDTVADASPVKLSASPAEYRRAAPLPGQDNDYVLHDLLGIDEEEITRLREGKII